MVEAVELPIRLEATSLNTYFNPRVKPTTVLPAVPGAKFAVPMGPALPSSTQVKVKPVTLFVFLGSFAQVSEIEERANPLIGAFDAPVNATGAYALPLYRPIVAAVVVPVSVAAETVKVLVPAAKPVTVEVHTPVTGSQVAVIEVPFTW